MGNLQILLVLLISFFMFNFLYFYVLKGFLNMFVFIDFVQFVFGGVRFLLFLFWIWSLVIQFMRDLFFLVDWLLIGQVMNFWLVCFVQIMLVLVKQGFCLIYFCQSMCFEKCGGFLFGQRIFCVVELILLVVMRRFLVIWVILVGRLL